MRRQILLIIFIIFRMISNAQEPVSDDTIHITDKNFDKVIEFRNEELYDLSGEVEKYATCFANADSLRQFLSKNRRDLFSKKFFDDDELEKFETDFNNYLDKEFINKDTLVVIRPSFQTAMEWRNALTDFNYAIFYLLRRDYYKIALSQGQIKFRLTKNNKYPTDIIVSKYEKTEKDKGNFVQTWKYILAGTDFEVYSHSKYDRIDETKKNLSHPDPIQWEFEMKQVKGDLYKVILRAKLVEFWEIYSINQLKGKVILPTVIRFNPSNEYELIGDTEEPKTKAYFDKRFDEKIKSHKELVEFTQTIKIKTYNPIVKGSIFFMVGNIESIKAPDIKEFEIRIN